MISIQNQSTAIAAQCEMGSELQSNYPDTPLNLPSTSKQFLMLSGPPGPKQCAHEYCKKILRSFWNNL